MTEFASGGLIRDPKPVLPAERGCDYVIPRPRECSMTIVEFLTARLDEDAAEAKAAPREDGYATHMSCVDPDRILADIEAKRALLTEPTDRCDSDYTCHGWERWEWTLRLLATSLYANHPDYSPEWRP